MSLIIKLCVRKCGIREILTGLLSRTYFLSFSYQFYLLVFEYLLIIFQQKNILVNILNQDKFTCLKHSCERNWDFFSYLEFFFFNNI